MRRKPTHSRAQRICRPAPIVHAPKPADVGLSPPGNDEGPTGANGQAPREQSKAEKPKSTHRQPDAQDADRLAHDVALCVGCETRRPTPTPANSRSYQCPHTDRLVWVCLNCTARAEASSVYRRLLEICARTGASLVAVSKALAHRGIAEVPTTPAAVTRAIEIWQARRCAS